MSLFRQEFVHLKTDSKVDMSNSATSTYAVRIPPFVDEVISFVGTAAGNAVAFVNPLNTTTYGGYKVVSATYTLETSAAAGAVLDLWAANSGTALASGATILNANININTATLATPTALNVIPTVLAAGQRVVVVVTGTLTGLSGLSVEVLLERTT